MSDAGDGDGRDRGLGEAPRLDGSVPGTSPGGRVRPPVAIIFGITLTGILANTLPNAALPDILDDLGQSDGSGGIFVAAGTIPGIVMAPVIGLLADRYGRRRVLLPCLVAFSVFGVLSAFAPSWPVLLLFRLCQGFGSAGLINLAVVLIGDGWEGNERVRLIGYNAAVLTVSVALLPALGGALAEIGGWRLAFAPYVLGLVTAVGVAHSLPRSSPAGSESMGTQFRAALTVVRRPVVAASLAFGFVLFALVFGLFLTTLSLHLDNEFGLEAGGRGLIIAAPATGATVAALSLGRMRARFGGARLLLAANALFVVGFCAIGTAPSIWVLIGGAVLYGLGEGTAIPTVQDVVAGAAPTESRGAVVALWVGSARAGQTVGPLMAGAGIATVGTGATFVAGGLVAAGLLVAQLTVPVRRLEAEAGLRSAA